MLTAFTCLNGHHWEAPHEADAGRPARRLVCPVCGAEAGPRDLGPADDSIPETRPPSVADRNSTQPSQPFPATASPPGDCLNNPGETATLADYEILGELGRGGMGIVYRALDRRRGQVVALKTMMAASPDALYRFKQEFRSRADLAHPNLLSLYELIADREQWFFTMELVEGADFLDHVRCGPGRTEAVPSRQPLTRPAQFERLRAALGQMASAVAALHRAGKLHRDLKPANVLVTPPGRVVVLDFGLVAELDRADAQQSTQGRLLGTAVYMAPEQAACRALTPAADWYSVGVILYEALTGRLPFDGDPLQVLHDKQRRDPPSPRAASHGIPDDLAELCVELLRRDPETRPAGDAVLRRLGTRPEDSGEPGIGRPAEALLVGRERHLESLREAFAALGYGKPVAVHMSGPSGAGKSTLARRFLEPLRAGGEVVVLEGQCYEQESVPYKAFDGVVDALSRFLGGSPGLEVQSYLPRDLAALLRVFPVLQRAVTGKRDVQVPDPQELRRRGFAALRELLARLGDRRPLVLCIDDLQWGDVDSAALLAELLRPPDAPVFLLVGCSRSEEAASPFLQSLRELRAETADAVEWRDLTVDPLTPREAQDLAARLLGSAGTAAAEAVARESGGNPFFVHELAQAAQAGARHEPGAVSLERVLWDRIEPLPKEARALLAVVATAGRPLRQAEACQAAGLTVDVLPTLALLRSQRLVRGRGLGSEGELAVYHDRVRETVARNLTADIIRGVHRRIAETLEATGSGDPEELAVHVEEGGEPERAGRYYARAADRAAEALAFDHAARLYRRALELLPGAEEETRGLRAALGAALANAGRGAESAEAFLAAAETATAEEVLELQRRAADQLLRSGHIEKGLVVLIRVLRQVGMSLPRTPVRSLVRLLFWRAVLWFRGVEFRERDIAEVPAEEISRIDVCWAAAVGLSLVDPIYGAYFQTRHLLLALRSGEPYRVALGLAMEVGYSSIPGGRTRPRTERLLKLASELAARINHPHALALASVWGGCAAWLVGQWQEARVMSEQAEVILRERCRGVAWELTSAQIFRFAALTWLGELKEHANHLPTLLREARERGDLYAATTLPLLNYAHVTRLAEDRPDLARQQIREALEGWSHRGFDLQHFWSLYGEVEIALYCGDSWPAWELVRDSWPQVKRSMLLRVQTIHIFALHLRGRCALAAAGATCASTGRPRLTKLLKAAEADARAMEKETMPWGTALARLLRAGVSSLRRDSSSTIRLLREAMAGLEAVDLRLYAAATRRRLGAVVGGTEGVALVAQADAWMAGQNIRNPARMTAAYAPGFPD